MLCDVRAPPLPTKASWRTGAVTPSHKGSAHTPVRFDVRPISPGLYRAPDFFDMSGEPSSACRRSARLVAKRAVVARVDEDGATPSRPSVEADSFATTSRCHSNVTSKSTGVSQPAKKLKTVQDDVRENTRTKGQDRTQRVSRHLEDAEKPKRGKKMMTLGKTSPKQQEAAATKSPAAAKRQRARAETTSSEPSRQAKTIRRRWRPTSRSSEASQGVTSSSGSYHTAKEMASDAGRTTPELEDDTLPTPAVRQTKFERLRRVWRWLVANHGAQSGAPSVPNMH